MSSPTSLSTPLRTVSPAGELLNLVKVIQNYADAAMWAHETYGEAVLLRWPVPTINLFHPEMVDHVLRTNLDNYVKSEDYETLRPILGDGIFVSRGEVWQRQRKLLSPEFRASVNHTYLPVMVRDVEQLFAERWEPNLDAPRDVGADFMFLTIRVVGDTIFASDFGEHADAIGRDLELSLEQAIFHMVTARLIPRWLPTPGNLRAQRAERDLNQVVGQLIGQARGALEAGDQRPAGMLGRLLQAKDAEGRPAMNDQQLSDEIKSMIIAGHETTSLALGWAFYLLDRHPEVRARLEAEADAVLGGRMPDVSDLPKLAYTRMVFQEVMRLYPPVPTVTRCALQDDEVRGVRIPAGAKVAVHPWVTHRHPDFWERPEVFDPERFLPEREKALPRGAYFPFLIGRRACLGEHFAMMEGIVALAAIAGRYRLERVEEAPLGTRPISTLRYSRPLRMRVRRR